MSNNMHYNINVKLMYVYKSLRSFFLIVAINILYYQIYNLSFVDIMYLGMIIALGNVILEVPSGAFADLYGRKLSMILGAVAMIIGYTFLTFGSSFIPFAIAMVFMAFSQALMSGADSAIVYDSMLEEGTVKDYKKVEGNFAALKMFFMGTGAVVGAFLFSYNIKLPYQVLIVISIIAFIVTIFLREPPRHKVLRTGWEQLRDSVKFSANHREVAFLLIYSGIMIALTLVGHRFQQPFMQDIGIDVKYFGLILMIIMWIAALFLRKVTVIEKYLGEKRTLILLPVLLVVAWMGMAQVNIFVGLIFLLIFQVASEMTFPIVKDYINRHVSSDMRATVLSLKGLSFNGLFFLISYFYGWLADKYSFHAALNGISITLLVSMAILLSLWFTKKK